MTTPYVGEIRIFGFPRIPTGWFACDGSLKPISEYQTLFALLGTAYGGDGQTTFAVPDLRGTLPLHWGTGSGLTTRVLGEVGGTENVTLLSSQMPAHTHSVMVTTNAASSATPGTSVLPGAVTGDTLYVTNLTDATPVALAAASVGQAGQNLPHDNTMPTLTLSICISWTGIFPSRN